VAEFQPPWLCVLQGGQQIASGEAVGRMLAKNINGYPRAEERPWNRPAPLPFSESQ